MNVLACIPKAPCGVKPAEIAREMFGSASQTNVIMVHNCLIAIELAGVRLAIVNNPPGVKGRCAYRGIADDESYRKAQVLCENVIINVERDIL